MQAERAHGSDGVVSAMVNLLIEPFGALESAERKRARLLATLLLSFITLGFSSAVVQALVVPNFEATLFAMLVALSFLCVAYVGSRTRLYRVSAALAATAPALACVAVGVRSPDDRVWYAFLLIAVILATLFFSVRTAAMVALAIFATLCLLPIWVVELRSETRMVPLLALHGVLSPLLLIAAHYQAAMERERQAELRRMDARLAELQHLEALGRVVSRAAHDFNNFIMTIDSNVYVLQHKLAGAGASEIADIRMALERASALSRELVASSKDEPSRARAIEPGELLRAFEPLLVRLAGPSIRVVVRSGATLPGVTIDPLRLERVLMNLVTNARDAMPEGGELLVECGKADLDETYVEAHPGVRPGFHVVIAVSDTGIGMDAPTLERVFEPFFTTKAPERGSGLGLAIVRDTIVEAGGHVTVSSEPGRGSTFRIHLPARAEPDS